MIWAITDTENLKRLRDTITDPDNRISVNAISFWKISFKSAPWDGGYRGFS